MILVPSFAATPMRQPENTWAMLVLAADVLDDTDLDREGEVALFAGRWLSEQPPAAACEGDLVLMLTARESEPPPDDLADVEMLLAHRNRWLRIGEWCRAEEFEQAVEATGHTMAAASVVHVEAVHPDDVATFLSQGEDAEVDRWAELVDHLRAAPTGFHWRSPSRHR